MSRKRKTQSTPSGSEWLTTYADLMTLLVTFFVLLYSFSSIDSKKFEEIAMSLSMALSGKASSIIDGGNITPTPVDGPDIQIIDEDGNPVTPSPDNSSGEDEYQKLYDKILSLVKENQLEANITLREDLRGVVIEIQEQILFDSGKAELKTDSIVVLSKLSEIIGALSNEVMVEGHTDNVPINKGYYRSNWELSADRAVKVVRYLAEDKKLNPLKLYAVGCGEYRPLETNDSVAGRQRNRRVDLVILTSAGYKNKK